jgi:hypothetical protein
MATNPRLYPVAIIESRYSGTYEGGKWHAIPEFDDVINTEHYQDYMYGDDGSALDFWDSNIASSIGVGDTPESALADMKLKANVITTED